MHKSTSELFGAEAPAAIVFDCDGVLVDSELAWLDVIEEALRRRGLDLGALESYRGITIQDAAERLAAASGEPLGPVRDEIAHGFSTALDAGVPVLPGVRGLITALAGTTPIAVASNSDRADLDRALASAGIAAHFSATVSADDVAHGKPEPDLYLLAAERLGVDPADCLAVEDSPVGSLAATRAGMRVAGVNADAEVSLTCHARFASMRELARALEANFPASLTTPTE